MRWLRWLLMLMGLMILLLAGWIMFGSGAHEPVPLDASKLTAASLRDPALIARGEYLTTVGDCAGCHTAQGGAPFAGGRAMATPFGTIPVPNITPDRATGMGHWSLADFWQALHAGKGRHGELLYPAFSYTSYTKVTAEDARAIFAYLKSLPAVHQPTSAPSLAFPYSMRKSLLAWRALYFRPGVFKPDSGRSASWNRGAYLVQGLGHCNECHAARNSLGASTDGPRLGGGQIPMQNWYAPDLSAGENGGLQDWSTQDIVDFLKTGQSAKGAAFGPMADVIVDSTQHITDDDLHAIATYLRALPARPTPVVEAPLFDIKSFVEQGETVYVKHCAACHGKNGEGVAGVYPPLNGNSTVIEPSGINATRMILLGGFAPVTAANPRPYSMPPFAQQLSDSEVSAVVSYIRHAWSNHASVVRPEKVSRYRHTPVD